MVLGHISIAPWNQGLKPSPGTGIHSFKNNPSHGDDSLLDYPLALGIYSEYNEG